MGRWRVLGPPLCTRGVFFAMVASSHRSVSTAGGHVSLLAPRSPLHELTQTRVPIMHRPQGEKHARARDAERERESVCVCMCL
jgi:hypothetical protein